MLAEPAPALSDLALGLIVVALAVRLHRVPTVHRHWRASFWWAGIAALAGFVHHGFVKYADRWDGPSWAIISGMVVVAVSYLLAATVTEVLGPRHHRTFWLLRSLGLIAYAGLAITGHAGVTALLACESLTMISILVLWARAARHHHPMAGPVIIALAASGAAAGTKALDPALTAHIGLDPTSVYHLAQIAGMVLLYLAIATPHRPTPTPSPAPG
ncbi:hypothetical protein BZB76_0385 [Actinomadura pelletieri DSM 43383]|uniref:Ceramidase n=1 Tax=Actinomadura pelletieri DSM 43383 TaxID=1120940 RepID=A0A495QY12_9ACTN|nr:hypothetical protein [Actinomadura pelletieri]RKS78947.1 hypothetical protein BZB76_0385 [Actinomadura pelletieri DSM 43383]